MVRHLFSKIALTIYALVAIGLAIWGYMVFKDRDGKIVLVPNQTTSSNTSDSPYEPQAQDNSENSDVSDNSQIPDTQTNTSNVSSAPIEINSAPLSPTPNVTGPMLAHITPQHCDDNCKAFANDLSLLEYCEQACGISPVKKVSDCDDISGIQKDYCRKDVAVNKQDASLCDKIKDANIKQVCQSRIAQDAEEVQRKNNVPDQNTAPLY